MTQPGAIRGAPSSATKLLALLIAIVVLTIGLCVALGVLLWGVIFLAIVFGTMWLWLPRRHSSAHE
jgi:hypothetical protein